MSFFDDSEEFAILLIYLCTPISTLAVILRSYSRWTIVQKFGLDDKLAIGACFCNVLASILNTVLLQTGGGRQVSLLSLEEFSRTLKVAIYDRAFLLLNFVAGFVIAQHLLFTFLVLFRCDPVSNVWDPIKYREGCLNWPRTLLAHSAVNIACDFTIYCLPLPSVLKLKVRLRRKLSVLALFLLGFIVLTASVWRLRTVIMFNVAVRSGTNAFTLINAATLEYNLALTIACIPGIKPLFKKFLAIASDRGTSFRISLNTVIHGGRNNGAAHLSSAVRGNERLESIGANSNIGFSASDVAIARRGAELGTGMRARPGGHRESMDGNTADEDLQMYGAADDHDPHRQGLGKMGDLDLEGGRSANDEHEHHEMAVHAHSG